LVKPVRGNPPQIRTQGGRGSFQRLVEAERQVSRTPQTLAEIEDRIRLNAGIADDAARAANVPRTHGRFGTRAHSDFEQLNNRLNSELRSAGSPFEVRAEEFRDVSGAVVGRRAGGSIGSDVVVYRNGVPIAGFDLKTGARWSASKLIEVQRRFGVSVTQIGTGAK
jgi:hypothetical protein